MEDEYYAFIITYLTALLSLGSCMSHKPLKCDLEETQYQQAAIAGDVQRMIALERNHPIDTSAQCKHHPEAAIIGAARNGHYNVVSRLIGQRATINIQSKKTGETALIAAVANGHENITRLLLEQGKNINVNEQALNGNTALMIATQQQDLRIVELLIAHKANPNISNNNSETPLSWVRRQGHSHLEKILNNTTLNAPEPQVSWTWSELFSPNTIISVTNMVHALINMSNNSTSNNNTQSRIHVA